MTPDTLTTPEKISLHGKTFTPAEQLPIPEWPCVVSERPQPTLTVKDDDLFLVTDTMGNISGLAGNTCCATATVSQNFGKCARAEGLHNGPAEGTSG